MNTGTITYRRVGPDEARIIVDVLKPVYAAVFSQPPYNEGPEMADKFVGWVNDESQHLGFTMIVAYANGHPAGFAYGYTMPAGQWINRGDKTPPAEIKAADKFAVMEWAVLPEHRGSGVGRTLMESLLDGRPEPWAVLMVNPAAEARAIYERAGWRHVSSTAASGTFPSMNVMALNRTEKVS